MSTEGCGVRDNSKNGAMVETLLIMSGGLTVDRSIFNLWLVGPVRCECLCIAAAALEAAKHETDPSNYTTMWDRHETSFGKERDGICEESVRFGNFESNDEAF